ncbi:MAG: 16S rRNA (cytosine(967)-C(5))-methyltransferase RsmB [Myxococcales bacterium]|nr:16S rRNA (cytosine(967)-C(5))-methyltransferase RsmB [Myxococcales bacterium]
MTARADSAREVARRVLGRVGEHGAWATLALAGELPAAHLDERDRRFATELVYGTLRHQVRLERALAVHADLARARPPVRAALLIAAYQLVFLRVPAHAAVDDAVTAVRARFGPKLGGFVNAVLRKLAAAGEPPLPTDPRERLAVEHSLAPWIVDEVAAQVPADELPAAIAALKAQAPLWIRVNRARATPAEVIAALVADGATAEPSPLDDHALAVRGLGDPARAASFRAGLWTVQDLAAQLVGHLMAPAPGERILDACAGVGGKTTHLAELAPGAHIDAVDPIAAKLQLATGAAARLGLRDITTHHGPLASLPPERVYDRVLVDAPCTGAGVLRRHPEAALRLTRADVTALAATQAELLRLAAARVRPGGVLVYAVCTVTAAEGPAQVAAFLAAHPEFELAPPPLPAAVVDGGAVRTWPHRHDADGFFAARLHRRG